MRRPVAKSRPGPLYHMRRALRREDIADSCLALIAPRWEGPCFGRDREAADLLSMLIVPSGCTAPYDLAFLSSGSVGPAGAGLRLCTLMHERIDGRWALAARNIMNDVAEVHDGVIMRVDLRTDRMLAEVMSNPAMRVARLETARDRQDLALFHVRLLFRAAMLRYMPAGHRRMRS